MVKAHLLAILAAFLLQKLAFAESTPRFQFLKSAPSNKGWTAANFCNTSSGLTFEKADGAYQYMKACREKVQYAGLTMNLAKVTCSERDCFFFGFEGGSRHGTFTIGSYFVDIPDAKKSRCDQKDDYQGAGQFPIRFSRWPTHRLWPALDPMPLGLGWRHNYEGQLTVTETNHTSAATVYRGDRAASSFFFTGSDWQRFEGTEAELSDRSHHGVLLGWTLTNNKAGYRENFDQNGRLISIERGEKLRHTLIYSDGREHSVKRVDDLKSAGTQMRRPLPAGMLVRIEHSSGAALDLSYDARRRVARISDGTGWERRYDYTEDGSLKGACSRK